LRLWVEPDNGWRWGVIEHVATREKIRFLSPSEILDFIAAHASTDEVSLPFTLDGDDPNRPESVTEADESSPSAHRPTTDDRET
jgi:hypothetical protein